MRCGVSVVAIVCDSAWVLELVGEGSGAIRGHAVQRRSEPGAGAASWYWYELADGQLAADGCRFEGPPLTDCSACHVAAPRDFVF